MLKKHEFLLPKVCRIYFAYIGLTEREEGPNRTVNCRAHSRCHVNIPIRGLPAGLVTL